MTKYENVPHPTDPSRSLVKDANRRLENYFKRKESQVLDPEHPVQWSTKDVAYINKSLREEYYPKPKEPVAADTKAEEKFEPFFEGEKADTPASESAPAESNTSNPTKSSQ